jgi:hypothetical protein
VIGGGHGSEAGDGKPISKSTLFKHFRTELAKWPSDAQGED